MAPKRAGKETLAPPKRGKGAKHEAEDPDALAEAPSEPKGSKRKADDILDDGGVVPE